MTVHHFNSVAENEMCKAKIFKFENIRGEVIFATVSLLMNLFLCYGLETKIHHSLNHILYY